MVVLGGVVNIVDREAVQTELKSRIGGLSCFIVYVTRLSLSLPLVVGPHVSPQNGIEYDCRWCPARSYDLASRMGSALPRITTESSIAQGRTRTAPILADLIAAYWVSSIALFSLARTLATDGQQQS
mgnify:CR=1 FL=1